MLVMLVPVKHAAGTNVGTSCDAECLETMGFTAKFGVKECIGNAAECPATAGCNTTMTWDKFRELKAVGKGYTGGLGTRVVKRNNREYGVWACIRDWNEDEQLKCGAQIGELACFRFEERKRTFEFRGLNSKTMSVSQEQARRGELIEDKLLRGRTLATSPDQDHV